MLSTSSLDDGLSEVLASVGDDSSDDDVAALVLRRTATTRAGRGGITAPVRMSA
jgi:hypothetical protein